MLSDFLQSGVLSPETDNLIGAGCVVHIPKFFEELSRLQEKDLNPSDRLFISSRAHVVLKLHQVADG